MKIRVAGAQIPVSTDVGANVEVIRRAIDFAADQKADILLTPEGSLSGYTHKLDMPRVAEALDEITARARELRLGLALGVCIIDPADQRPYNQIRFFAPDGSPLGAHSKILRTGAMDGKSGEAVDFATTPLSTFDFAGVKIGGLICNDMWADPMCTPMPDPHLTQQLSEKGARIIFHAVNGGRDDSKWSRNVVRPFHETNLRMRASTGDVWIVTVDNAHPLDCPASSPAGVIDPDGQWACQTADRGEQFFAHTIDLDEISGP